MVGEDSGGVQDEGELAFPVYRKSLDNKHFYRIESRERFVEVQRVGNRQLLHHVTANAYPEKLRIMEMIECFEGRYLPMGSEEWATMRQTGGRTHGGEQ
jgi:hypothetical protein